jgi:hypothetical protein
MEVHSTSHFFGPVVLLAALVFSFGMGLPNAQETIPVPSSASGCPVPAARMERPPLTSTADFVVTANGAQQWVVNGTVNPTLTLTRGHTYTFDLTAFLDEHPFLINSNASNPWGTIFLPSTYGQVVSFTPDFVMPAAVYYHCEVHYGGMAGAINLIPPCTGDITADGQVNVADFLALNSAFGSTCSGCAADIDQNGVVNVGDFLDLNSVYGSSCL